MSQDDINALADAIVSRLDLPGREEILEAIASGVSGTSTDIISGVVKGISEAMPWPSEILDAIYGGMRDSRKK